MMAGRNDNLVPFKKGQSGNPKGRPKKENCLTDILRSQADAKGPDGRSKKNALAEKLWEMALDGDIAALKYVYDRIDGKPKESIKQEVDLNAEISIIFGDDED